MYQDNATPTSANLFAHVLGEDAAGWLVAFAGRQARFSNPDARHNELVNIRQRSFRYPDALDEAAAYLLKASRHKYDAYFAVHLFRSADTRRASEAADVVSCLWLDEDEGSFPSTGPEPTVVVCSSRERRHLYWKLTRPIPAAEAVALNRRIAAWSSGDMGAAALARVLRVPGTNNYKRYPEVDPVTAEFSDFVDAWEPEVLDQAIPELPEPPRHIRTEQYDGPVLELAAFIDGVEVIGSVPDGLGQKLSIVCPWVQKHTGGDRTGTFVGQYESGPLWFYCHHQHCRGRTWRDFKREVRKIRSVREFRVRRGPGHELRVVVQRG